MVVVFSTLARNVAGSIPAIVDYFLSFGEHSFLWLYFRVNSIFTLLFFSFSNEFVEKMLLNPANISVLFLERFSFDKPGPITMWSQNFRSSIVIGPRSNGKRSRIRVLILAGFKSIFLYEFI